MAIVKLNDRGVRNVSEFGSVAPGSMVFIKKLTASSDGDLTFVDGASDVVLDDTYKEYLFTFKDIHPATDGAFFTFNGRDGGSSYDATKTTTFIKHFMARIIDYNNNAQPNESYMAGYCNTTSAIDGVQFKFSSGNVDAGTIKMYGIKDS